MTKYETADDIAAATHAMVAQLDGYARPAAHGLGVATKAPSGAILDVSFPNPNLHTASFFAAASATVSGYRSTTATAELSAGQVDELLALVSPAGAYEGVAHPNLEMLASARTMLDLPAPLGGTRIAVVAAIADLDDPPLDAIDAYLRLHLLSHCLVPPHGVNLDGVFGKLTNCVWTNLGPFEVEGFDLRRAQLRALGHDVLVHGLDKFPRMTDYVTPAGVRIADANACG